MARVEKGIKTAHKYISFTHKKNFLGQFYDHIMVYISIHTYFIKTIRILKLSPYKKKKEKIFKWMEAEMKVR